MRRQLDRRFAAARAALDNLRRPSDGWIRTIRAALGMTSGDLAVRIGVSPQRVRQMEKDEAAGAVTLATLENAAEALGCDLVCALVPRGGLEDRVRNQAVKIARADMAVAGRHMALEDQAVDGDASTDLVEDRAREIAADPPRGFWQR
jgi:predicted DNA-binding mobile mystery protein A